MFHYFSNKAFLNNTIDHMSVNRIRPVYKGFLLLTTHPPIVVDKDCEYAGKVLPLTRENIKIQQKCGLDHVVKFLDKLKLIGIYDSSLIILQADTGAGQKVKMRNMDKKLDGDSISINKMGGNSISISKKEFDIIVGSALPLLAIKPPHSKGRLKISRAHGALIDIPATISSILNLNEEFNGRSVFEIDPNEVRERTFYYYKWRHKMWQYDYFDHMDEFVIRGSVFDRASWRWGFTYHAPEALYETQKIDFGTDEASRFLHSGWFYNQRDPKEGYSFNYVVGSSASVFISLPKDEAVLLTANVKSVPFSKPQHITIKVDGSEIGSWELYSPWILEKHGIVIEPDVLRPEVSVVEFIFSQHRIFEWSNNNSLATLFESITLSKLTPYKWGSVIQFGVSGNAESYQTRGWSGPENGFTWSDGQSASLTVPITIPKSHITLKANLFAFVGPGKVDKQTVEIMINGKRAGQWMITKPGVHEKMVIIPKSFFTNVNSLKITFNMPDAISPAEVGHNNDNRVLGIAVCSIKLTESS